MEIKDRLDEAGVGLVVIGSGSPDQAKVFVAAFNYKGEIYVDPALKTYRAFKLKRGVGRTLGPSAVVRGIFTMKKGFRQGKTAGDPWQQGGMFVLGPGDRMVYAHRNQAAGDQANLDEVLQALTR